MCLLFYFRIQRAALRFIVHFSYFYGVPLYFYKRSSVRPSCRCTIFPVFPKRDLLAFSKLLYYLLTYLLLYYVVLTALTTLVTLIINQFNNPTGAKKNNNVRVNLTLLNTSRLSFTKIFIFQQTFIN